VGVFCDRCRHVELWIAVITGTRRVLAQKVPRIRFGKIEKAGRAEGTLLDDFRDAPQLGYASSAQSGIVTAFERRDYRVTVCPEAAGEPQTGKRTSTGQKDSHFNPRNNSVP
jgi:hypothetical protein